MKRLVGSTLCLAPAALLLVSLLVGLVGHARPTGGGLWLVLPGLFVAGLNFSLSFIRPRLHRRRHGSMEGYRFVSGLPVLGTLLVTAGGIWDFGAPLTAALGLGAVALDTGGSAWFLIATWRDPGVWSGGRAGS